MRRHGRTAISLALALAACAPVTPPAPVSKTWAVHLEIWDDRTPPVKVPGALVEVDVATGHPHLVGTANFEGNWTAFVPAGLAQSHLWVRADGFLPYSQHLDLTDGVHVPVTLRHPRPLHPPRPLHTNVLGRLRVDGRLIVYPDGRRFIWRGVTAFTLLAQLAHGQLDEAEAFLSWAQATGFNLVRVLAMVSWGDLPPTAGRAHLDRLLEAADAHDLYVELVALADTRTYNVSDEELRDQVAAVGAACARHESCAGVELANENLHPSQLSSLSDAALVRQLQGHIPPGVLVSLGSNCCGQPDEPEPEGTDPGLWYPPALRSGSYVTVHPDRTRDKWNLVRRVRERENLSRVTARPVIEDEPIGAAEVDDPGRRLNDPAAFFGLGVLSRVFEVGMTFHCEDCLHAKVPGPAQRACAEAFVAGTRLWGDQVDTAFFNAGWAGSPVKDAAFGSTIVRAYSAVVGSSGWAVLVGVLGDPGLRLNEGWALGAKVAERPGIQVWEVRRKKENADEARRVAEAPGSRTQPPRRAGSGRF